MSFFQSKHIISLLRHVCLIAVFMLGMSFVTAEKVYAQDQNLIGLCEGPRDACEDSCEQTYASNGNSAQYNTCRQNCTGVFLDCMENAESADEYSDALSDTLCRIIKLLLGRTGRVIVTIALFFLGVGIFMGKVNWGSALVIIMSITGMFGAIDLVEWFTGHRACVGTVDSPANLSSPSTQPGNQPNNNNTNP